VEGGGPVSSKAIASLAILKVNYDQHRDYLDTFVPIVAECIRHSPDEVISTGNLQAEVRDRFGLHLPQHVIDKILKKAKRRGHIRQQKRVYHPVHQKLATLPFHEIQQQTLRKHEELIQNLKAFAKQHCNTTWSTEEAEKALLAYLETNQLFILSGVSHGSVVHVDTPPAIANYVVGRFIEHLQHTHSAAFEYLETIVKGNMLANAVFLPDPYKAQQRFQRTEIYLDTSFLIYALGYSGSGRQAPCTELLDLLYNVGAELRCFVHTAEEIKAILYACADLMQARQDIGGPMVETLDYFVSTEATPSDIRHLATKVDRSLDTKRIKVVEKPEYEHRYLIDERGLGDILKQLYYSSELARTRDVDSISAIMRLRRGRQTLFIEHCGALFITTNTSLARLSREFFYREARRDSVPPCIADFTLTNLVWLKNPLQAPDLPRKRIIADYYAAMQPNEHLWRLYLEEIGKLMQQGTITESDYHLLRYSTEARKALMDVTLGDETAFTHGTVSEILDYVRSQIKADEIERRKVAERKLQVLLAEQETRKAKVRARADKIAGMVAFILKVVIILVLLAGSFVASPLGDSIMKCPGNSRLCTPVIRWIVGGLILLMIFLSTVGPFSGLRLDVYVDMAKRWLSNKLEMTMLSITE
jgi:hypothetical protein